MTNFIKNFWDNQAKRYGESHQASWGDNFALQLEIDNIAKYIRDNDYVLDAGCANGYSAFQQLKKKEVIKIEGIDFSESMINIAKESIKLELNPRINFRVADIKKLPFADETFNVTYTTRCLINLSTWDEQIQGISECLRVTKKGGLIILSEAFYEPLQKLNAVRLLCNLEPLVEHDFNRYIKKKQLEYLLISLGFNEGENSNEFKCDDFSSVYYLGSRLLRELVTNPEDYPGYSNPINEYFYRLEKDFSGGGFGIQQSYIIKK